MESKAAHKNAVLFIGIQASGKSTFYNERYSHTHVHVSLDALNTRNKERLLFEDCIETGRSFVVDNTNPTALDRARYIGPAKQAGYHIIGIFFKSVISDCIDRNRCRTGKQRVPDIAVAATSNKLEIPSLREGFDELYYVYIENERFVVEKWNEDEI